MPRSIYSSRQAMAPGTYETPVADFLDKLPGYIQDFQKNQLELGKLQLLNKRYDNEQEYIKERDKLADARYIAEQKIKANAVDENRKRYLRAEKRLDAKEERDEERHLDTLVASSYKKGDPRYISYAISKAKLDGDGAAVGRLTSLQKQNQDFESELSSLYTSVNTAGNLRGIASSQLMVEEFMNTYADNPNFTPTSPAYTNVIKMKNQLGARMAQVPSGLVPPDNWEDVFGPLGRESKDKLDLIEKNIKTTAEGMAAMQKDSDQKKNAQKKLKIYEEERKKLVGKMRVHTTKSLKSARERISPYVSDAGGASSLSSDLAGFQMFQTTPFDPNMVEQPSITEAEMNDVSKQIATQNEIETNISKINESIPGLATTTPTGTTAITDENITALTGDDAEAYNPNKVGLDPDDPSTVPASFLEPITETDIADETPEVVDATTTDTGGGVSSAIIDRLFPDQTSAAEVPEVVKVDPVETDVKTEEFKIKSPSEFPSKKYQNVRGLVGDLSTSYGGFGIGDVEYLNNLLIQKEKATTSFRKEQVDKGIKKVSDRLKGKIGDYIDPSTGEFADSKYNSDFYRLLSLKTGLPKDRIAEILKGISTVKASKSS